MTLKPAQLVAFSGNRKIAGGDIETVAVRTKEFIDSGHHLSVLIFDADTSQPVEFDFRGTVEDVRRSIKTETVSAPDSSAAPCDLDKRPAARRGPGRPKLGVVAREVTLLPRHWDWLNNQPGGASVALRKLVEEARRTRSGADDQRQAQESAYRFMSAMAGNFPNFEEATRALFAKDAGQFHSLIAEWPGDVLDHCKKLASRCF